MTVKHVSCEDFELLVSLHNVKVERMAAHQKERNSLTWRRSSLACRVEMMRLQQDEINRINKQIIEVEKREVSDAR